MIVGITHGTFTCMPAHGQINSSIMKWGQPGYQLGCCLRDKCKNSNICAAILATSSSTAIDGLLCATAAQALKFPVTPLLIREQRKTKERSFDCVSQFAFQWPAQVPEKVTSQNENEPRISWLVLDIDYLSGFTYIPLLTMFFLLIKYRPWIELSRQPHVPNVFFN